MKYFTLLALLTAVLSNMSCVKQHANTTVVKLPVTGKYTWAFSIPTQGNQVSTHTFSHTVIDYEMKGSVYNVVYQMTPISYDAATQKCITLVKDNSTKKGKYFVLFFKDITAASVLLYKAEMETEAQAKAFARPADNDTQNHGWNKYDKVP